MQLPDSSAITAFCSELREARDFKRISIDEVAKITCITRDYLYALEKGEWDRIPTAYLRGYLALYANAVSMNSDKVLKTFDQLVSREKPSRSAVLDTNPPLLEQPQYVEVTRAPIRAAWYAALIRHQAGFIIVTVALLMFLMGFLYWQAHWGTVPERTLAFAIALREHGERVHSPLTLLPIGSNDSLDEAEIKYSAPWVRWIGSDHGSMTVQRDQDSTFTLFFDPYDTIKIQYVRSMNVRLYPPGSARARQDTTRLFPDKELSGEIEVFVISVPKDSGTVTDSQEVCTEKTVD
ncbi:MAG: helix-turn-helix domain-containing protein [Calditrichota bacterium]